MDAYACLPAIYSIPERARDAVVRKDGVEGQAPRDEPQHRLHALATFFFFVG